MGSSVFTKKGIKSSTAIVPMILSRFGISRVINRAKTGFYMVFGLILMIGITLGSV